MYDYALNTEYDELDVAMMSEALFEQYDEPASLEAANDEDYDNLYPMPA